MSEPEPAMSGARDSATFLADRNAAALEAEAKAAEAPKAETEAAVVAESSGSQAAPADKPATPPKAAIAESETGASTAEAGSTPVPEPSTSTDVAGAADAAGADGADAALQTPQPPPAAVVRTRSDSLAIGHPDDSPASDSVVCVITLLLVSGARHPYRIDEKYLAKRNVDVPGVTESGKKDPFSISVYKLKELILREWRDDWEGKPASPSSIRLIHFGKLLEDKEPLKKYHFSADAPNVVHMSVKPAEMLEDEEAGKKVTSREPRNREGGSGCCIIL